MSQRTHYNDLLEVALDINCLLVNASGSSKQELVNELGNVSKKMQLKLKEFPYIDNDDGALGKS